jgi:hypothetical protein
VKGCLISLLTATLYVKCFLVKLLTVTLYVKGCLTNNLAADGDTLGENLPYQELWLVTV